MTWDSNTLNKLIKYTRSYNLNQVNIHSAYLGTIAIDVSTLNTTSHKNWDFNLNYVAQLIDSFKQGVRRFFKEVRMRASMTPEKYNIILQFKHTLAVKQAKTASLSKFAVWLLIQMAEISDFVHLQKWPDVLKSLSLIAGRAYHKRQESNHYKREKNQSYQSKRFFELFYWNIVKLELSSSSSRMNEKVTAMIILIIAFYV